MKLANTTMKLTLAVGFFLGSILASSADPVAFQVDMSVQTTLGNFHVGNGDTVLVAGNWDGYATTHTMAVSANTNIYTLTLNLAAGSFPLYKFIINPNGTSSGTSLNWEVPGSTGGGNRFFTAPGVPVGGTNLPVVFFSDVSNAPSYQVQVTFQVNMSAAITQGHFTIGSDYVDAFGSFNNWATTGVLLTNVPGTSNFVGILTTSALTTNTLINYKYAIDGNGGTWEGNVGSNGAQNRSFTLVSTNQVLPLDYWNNITNANLSFAVLFQVDMIVEYALGNFTPGSDLIYVNGDWDWSGSAMQLLQTADPNVYTGTVALAYSPGTTINYKYAINGGILPSGWENNGVGPGGANNRQFVLNAATNLPGDFFNNITNLGPVNLSRLGTQATLSWASGSNANNHIRLQTATNLLHGWSDVPNTQGRVSVTNNFGPAPMFFRLIGP